MPDPFNNDLRKALIETSKELKLKHHEKGTVITIEGPRFSTRAESNMFRIWGADVINMSVAPECVLANEMGIPYAAVAMSTDYDCWKTDEADVILEALSLSRRGWRMTDERFSRLLFLEQKLKGIKERKKRGYEESN